MRMVTALNVKEGLKGDYMCKSKYKNVNPSTLYLLRSVSALVEKSKSDFSFFKPALDLDVSTIRRYIISPSCCYCPPASAIR